MVETHEEHPNRSICERVIKGTKVLQELDCKLNWLVTNPAGTVYLTFAIKVAQYSCPPRQTPIGYCYMILAQKNLLV